MTINFEELRIDIQKVHDKLRDKAKSYNEMRNRSSDEHQRQYLLGEIWGLQAGAVAMSQILEKYFK